MKTGKKLLVLAFALVLGALTLYAAETKAELTSKLWPKSRIEAALKAIEKQKTEGLISDALYRKKKAMLEGRLRGTFQPTMLSATNPPLNFIQNAGFEEVNKNSAANRSRWLWWGGWSWGGEYENRWEEDPKHVRSGQFSARIACKGAKGRIGISTPKIPVFPGATAYEFTIWAKGTPGNNLFINFEAGANGRFNEAVGADWQQVTVRGTPTKDAADFMIYIYVTGTGTIWLDDAKLVPVGANLED